MAARHMAVVDESMDFETALLCSQWVLDDGCVPARVGGGKKAKMTLRRAQSLAHEGWLALSADVIYLREITLREVANAQDRLDDSYHFEMDPTSLRSTEKAQWWAAPSGDLIDLVVRAALASRSG